MAYPADASNRVFIQQRNPEQNSKLLPQSQRFSLPRHPVHPKQILSSFNTRAFKREQPDKPELMLRVISAALAVHEPIPFVMYWGKGFRPVLAQPEFVCLDYLGSMLARVAAIYEPGASAKLVFTDTHAALNGHSRESIESYFEDLTRAARQRSFDTCLLSSLLDVQSQGSDDAPEPEVPSEELLDELSVSASKWFRGEGTIRGGAIRYYQANMIEKKAMDRAFSGSIFVTFNGSQLRSLFPDALPIFYMFSLRHGVSDKPWFLPTDYPARRSPANVVQIQRAPA